MSDYAIPEAADMIRWTFDAKPEHRAEIETYLVDLGLDVMVVGEAQFHVTWDEPDRDMAEVASELWEINEESCEITQEEFRRLGHFLIHLEDEAKAA